jgi:exonuclease SbcC
MILKSLFLENIRTYKNQKINFKNGINFLSGDIGSGKSTILMAIEFCIFGIIRGEVDGISLLRKGENLAKVKLILEDKDKNLEVEITRTLKKSETKNSLLISQKNGELRVNENSEELSPEELNSRVFTLFNFPKQFFKKNKNLIYRYSTYTSQDQLKKIIFDNSNSENKLNIIREIFNINKYKRIDFACQIFQKSLKEKLKKYQIQIEEKSNFQNELINDYKLFKENVLNFQNDLTKILKEEDVKKIEKLKKENDLKIKQEKQKEIEKNIFKIKEELKQMEIEKKEIGKLNFKKSNLEKQTTENSINLKNETLKKFETEFEIQENKIEKNKILFEENLDKINLEIENKKNKIEKQQIKIEKFEKLIFKINNIEKDLNPNLKEDIILKLKKYNFEKKDYIKPEILKLNLNKIKNTNLKEIEIEITKFEEKINSNEKSLKSISHKNKCDICFQEISEIKNKEIKNNYETKINNFELTIKNLKKDKLKLKETINLEEEKLTKNENLKLTLINLQNEIKNLQEKNKLEKNKKEEVLNFIKEIENLGLIKNFDILILKNDFDLLKKQLLDLEINLNLEKEKNLKENEEFKNLELKISKLKNEILSFKQIKFEITQITTQISNLKEKIENEKVKIDDLNLFQIKEKNLNLEIQKLENDFKILKNEEKEILIKKVKLETQKLNNEKTQNSYLKIIEDVKLLKIKNLKVEKKINLFEKIRISFLPKIERILFKKYYTEFNEIFRKIFKELIEDNELEVYLDETFKINIISNGFEIAISNLSGGEKSSVSLAYKLGLKYIIDNNNNSKNLNFLILDEPTDGFSNFQINRFSTILKNLNSKQIIMVSHDESLKSICDNLIKIEKTNHLSKVF